MPARWPCLALLLTLLLGARAHAQAAVTIDPLQSRTGYVATLLINEVPFPGERRWVSESDTKNAMLAILWVLHGRIELVPDGYRQVDLATVTTDDVREVISAGGVHGQCEGFYKEADRFVVVDRVQERRDYLAGIANKGEPGRFARIMNYAIDLASAYDDGGIEGADRFAKLRTIDGTPVTGRAYSWMTDEDIYHPGGNYVRIPDEHQGGMGANRFFTLRELP
ncbi:hypothetical protein [Mucisphaera calidilacus]|uniref:Uncharacterized protein n=1 Tax=Mucisphaera calidilacus TaxID=2527982 RepID=A0A518BYI4_9BACT|nr:hypothetical protein [Mucisphaera calidilacus]QDU72024.1 hypothetical protein Pan265_18840 [Mucisphaera calidilacus]